MRQLLLGLALLLSAASMAAQSPPELPGTWVWEVDGRNLIVLQLQDGPQGPVGSLQRPARITFGMGAAGIAVSGIQMPVRSSPVQPVRTAEDGQVMRTTGADGSTEEFVLRPDGKGAMLLRVDPNPAAPTITLTRPRDPRSVATDWDPEKTYLSRAPSEKSSSELAGIFAADQADRSAGLSTDWKVVAPRDKARRLRVKQMLDDGQLHSGDDYYRAAFIFQHGEEPNDYLLAHVLAMAAQGKGHPQAGWIAMATLDRYLHTIGKAQVLGTQSPIGDGGVLTKGLYDDSLIPDSLRVALGVPTRAEEAAQRAAMGAARK